MPLQPLASQWIDQRPETAAQLLRVALINNSPQALQQQARMAHMQNSAYNQQQQSIQAKINRHSDPVQLKSEIKHTADFVTDDSGANHVVGNKMEAKLDYDDPVVGTATGVNWTWMQALRRKYRSANVIRGHLLNHDLGGFGEPHNLYPISTKANMEHSATVEQKVKDQLFQDKANKAAKRLCYNVTVISDTANNPSKARFECEWGHEGAHDGQQKTINSDLGGDTSAPYVKDPNSKVSPVEWQHGNGRGDTNRLDKTTADYVKTKNIELNQTKDLAKTAVSANINAAPGTQDLENLWKDAAARELDEAARKIRKKYQHAPAKYVSCVSKGILEYKKSAIQKAHVRIGFNYVVEDNDWEYALDYIRKKYVFSMNMKVLILLKNTKNAHKKGQK